VATYKEIFKTIRHAYDLAATRLGTDVDDVQRNQDLLNVVTEFHRVYQLRLAQQREKRKKAAELKARKMAELAARSEQPTVPATHADVALPTDSKDSSDA
jgi:hypothetical protein